MGLGVLREASSRPRSPEWEMESGPGLSSQALVPISFVAFLAETSHPAALELGLKQCDYLLNPIDSLCYTRLYIDTHGSPTKLRAKQNKTKPPSQFFT